MTVFGTPRYSTMSSTTPATTPARMTAIFFAVGMSRTTNALNAMTPFAGAGRRDFFSTRLGCLATAHSLSVIITPEREFGNYRIGVDLPPPGEQEHAEHDQHRARHDAPAQPARRAGEDEGEQEHEERHRAGQGS